MPRHGLSSAIALALVLLGSGMQILARRRLEDDQTPRPASTTVVNVVAPAAVMFIAAAVTYLRIAGVAQSGSSKVTTVLIAVALLASAGYTLVVAVVALAVAVANHGVRRAWASLWVVTATSVTAAVLLPIGWGR